jgi:hypothetical protein
MSANQRDYDGAFDDGSQAHLTRRHTHVALHRLWVCANMKASFTAREYFHILACEECSRALKVCLAAENFGGMLRQLSRDLRESAGDPLTAHNS